MTFETKRLYLRPFEDSDAKSVYEYAKDDRVGPAAGWPVHTSVENSLEIIRTVLSDPLTFAITLKDTNEAIGSISLMKPRSDQGDPKTEMEIGYWIGAKHWGNGYMPEAVKCLEDYAFNVLNLKALWCGYYEGNDKSKRVQEKCGFKPHHIVSDVYCPLVDEIRTEHYTYLSKEDYKL